MIKHNLKKNKHTLNDQDIERFAELTDGYSGSDMANLVKDAVYGPVRKCQTATYWAKIAELDGSLKYMPLADKEVKLWNPNQLVKMSLTDIQGDQLKVPETNTVRILTTYNILG